MRILLSSPLIIAGRTVDAVEVRPPGLAVFRLMQSARGPVRFPEAATVKFAARLSGHSEPTIRRLSPDDLATVGQAVEQLYEQARRRFGARAALAQEASALKAKTEGGAE